MTIISIWCRHIGDNIIGIGANIPWNVPSDAKRFRNITKEQTLVVGKKTYESFPNRTLPNRKFLVVTSNKEYEVSDIKNHQVVNDIKKLKDYPEDLYVSGGAGIYNAFFAENKLMPDIVVDCVYFGEIDNSLDGEKIAVTPSVEIMQKKYWSLPQTFELDNVKTTIWLKKGDFVEQSVVKKIITYLETEGK